jgi:hypothetical protein
MVRSVDMQKLFLKIGCFFIGYNYGIIRNASEVSAKMVRKYASAIYIVSVLWGFIGYSFANRYLKLGVVGSLLVSAALVFVVIQIERQIILSVGKTWVLMIFRSVIAVVMAFIGSVILDQIMFKEDIERKKVSSVQEEVNKILPSKTAQLEEEIKAIDSLIRLKEAERSVLANEVSRRPFIKGVTRETRSHKVRLADRDTIETRVDEILVDVKNPKIDMLSNVDVQLESMRTALNDKQARRLDIRNEIERELKSKTGLLDEINVIWKIITSSIAAFIVWIAFFLFFFAIELFVVMSKFFEKNNEYERIILSQMQVNLGRLVEDERPK